MLAGLGLALQPRPAHIVEPSPQPEEEPEAYALRVATAKAEACLHTLSAELESAVIMAADTIVCIDNEILGKPRDRAHAVDMLLLLAGREHRVITACCLRGPDICEQFAVASRVVFIPFDRRTAEAYVDTGEPMDKAGAYAVQGIGACLTAEVHGSWTNVVGLPLAEVTAALLRLGVIGLCSSAAGMRSG